MGSNYKFEGWLGKSPESIKGKMEWEEFEPKKWDENDVDIKISHCGICGSDLHTLRSGWAPTNYPCCVGHEIVGHAVKVGKNAERGIKEGDRVGVGAQSSSCLRADCEACADGLENHCPRMVATFDAPYPDGYVAKGGYATYSRVPSHFVFKIPEGLSSEEAAPMLCGGITVYSPLKDNGCGPGKKVGIVGFGGLGHFGVLYAKALGADSVTVISRSSTKKEDALKMGADHFIATSEEKDWASGKHANSLDLLVSTVSSPNMPLEEYLSLLRIKGTFIQVGAPDDKLPSFNAFSLIVKGVKIGGSAIGPPAQIEEMLKLSVSHKVKPWIQTRPMKEANQAVVDMEANKARFRYVLVN